MGIGGDVTSFPGIAGVPYIVFVGAGLASGNDHADDGENSFSIACQT